MAQSTSDFLYNIWYFAGLSRDLKTGQMIERQIAGEPISLGRDENGKAFALRDICPHRAALLSSGRVVNGTVECPFHGWRFSTEDGSCQEIPALCAGHDISVDKIGVRSFPIREDGQLIWIYISSDKKFSGEPDIDPPAFPFTARKPSIDDKLILNCHIDHAVMGLIDPAHGPYVHRQWWWRSERSMHEKAKDFAPRDYGFAMVAHSPSSNSFAYKLLGGKPITEITLRLPGVRTEEIKIGKKTVLSFTIVTPIDENRTEIRQIFFTDHLLFKILKPLISWGAYVFLRQDAAIVDVQKKGLKYDPSLLLVGDVDQQAKWYFNLKKAWAKSRATGQGLINPVKPQTLRWRS